MSHCILHKGDKVNEYTIKKFIGRGRFAFVYKASDVNGNKVALKIYRAGSGNNKQYKNEISIYGTICNNSHPNIIQYINTNKITKLNNIYPYITFNLGGCSISQLISYFSKTYNTGIPITTVKHIMRKLLGGLEYLHKNDIIHTDIKPGNLLTDFKIKNINYDFNVLIADLGSSMVSNNITSYHVGTTTYIAPELIAEMYYTNAIDIWSAFATCYELITGDILFDVYNQCGIYTINSLSNNTISNNTQTTNNSSVSESDSENEMEVNYQLLLLIERIIGPAPPIYSKNAQRYYNKCGNLKYSHDIKYIGISGLLSNYDIDISNEIEDFLSAGLRWIPSERITATDALKHPFLQL